MYFEHKKMVLYSLVNTQYCTHKGMEVWRLVQYQTYLSFKVLSLSFSRVNSFSFMHIWPNWCHPIYRPFHSLGPNAPSKLTLPHFLPSRHIRPPSFVGPMSLLLNASPSPSNPIDVSTKHPFIHSFHSAPLPLHM